MQESTMLYMLPLSAEVMGTTDWVYPTLLRDGDSAMLVDTGYPRQMKALQEALAQAGITPEKLTAILITHQDLDHIGNLPELVQASGPSVEVIAHELEKPYIQGDRRLIKITDEAIARIDSLPKEVPLEWRQGLKAILVNPPKANVGRSVVDGEKLPYGGGIIVIGTPGHTPGHISLYHEPTRTLIAGDALVVAEGELYGPSPEQTHDMEQAIQSLGKLKDYDIETVICYHGGRYTGDANRRIAELANSLLTALPDQP
ncbi:MBL fold metallo-hydrolase [Paenibacillus sp. 32352]|uniref:MBL fold metallo-hydrolase n=1 Tax=Paenibacillus sp. 32352 TaxID=1969111 RepID=UPI0009AEE74D|nr:MBL fold metallo-hydrolase [Paenibacillus sp. 32352]